MGLINLISTTKSRLFDFVGGHTAKSADVDAEFNQVIDAHNNMLTDLGALNTAIDSITGAGWNGTDNLANFRETLDDAVDASMQAVSTANAANSSAGDALVIAGAAEGKADTAISTANGAVTTANAADGKANTAITTANAAMAKATQVESDFNAWTPVMEQAVNSVAGKADVAYVDQVAADFQQGVTPDDSIMEEKLNVSVREKLNKDRIIGTYFRSDAPNKMCDTPAITAKYHKYLIPLPTRAELEALMPTNAYMTMFNFDVELCKFGFNEEVSEISTMPHIIVSILLEFSPNFYISGTYSVTNLMGSDLQNLNGSDLAIMEDATGELYAMIELTYADTSQPAIPAVLRAVDIYTNNPEDTLLNFATPWSIIGKFENTFTPPTGYTGYESVSFAYVNYVPNPVIPPSYFDKGRSTFNSTTGRVINLTFAAASVDEYDVFITPTADPSGFLGEFWVVKGLTSFTVFCSGSTTTTGFAYIVF